MENTEKSSKKTSKESRAASSDETNGSNSTPGLREVGSDAEDAEVVELSETESLKADVADLKDKYLRTMAEMDNVRRRADKERSDLIKYGMESFFKDFLVVLDSFDKAAPEAQKADGTNLEQFVEGMVMVKKQLSDLVEKHGLQKIESADVVFDPNLHQAIQRVEEEGVKEEVVNQEFATGYLLNGRLLRPSMVSVKVPKA